MAQILGSDATTGQAANTASTGVAITGSTCHIEVRNNSVFNGAVLIVEACSVNTAGYFSPMHDKLGTITSPGWVRIDLPSGTFVRLVQAKSGASTSIIAFLHPTA